MSILARALLVLLPVALLAGGGAATAADPATVVTDPYVPPPDTIVLVEGDAANGFGIERYDGSWEYPPTDSETIAECNEYDRFVRRLRCRVSTRTWYRALAGFKETTHYYRAVLH